MYPGHSEPTSKRALLVISHAMEGAFLDNSTEQPVEGTGLVIGLFQHRVFFDVEAAKYAGLAASGHLVIVGFEGSVQDLPAGVHGIRLSSSDPLAVVWALMLIDREYATSLTATDLHHLTGDELTLDGSRMFDSRWSFLRDEAAREARALLEVLAPRLPSDVARSAQRRIDAVSEQEVLGGERQIATAAAHLVRSLESSHRRTLTLRRALESTQSLAEEDQLTGLKNRRFLERYRHTSTTVVPALLLDLDDLKEINDVMGHAAGDVAIRAIADVLARQSAPSGVVVRWGGDEFLVLLPGSTVRHAYDVASRITDVLRDTRLAPPLAEVRLSASIGVGVYNSETACMDDIDHALYEVKRNGKGRVAVAPSAAALL